MSSGGLLLESGGALLLEADGRLLLESQPAASLLGALLLEDGFSLLLEDVGRLLLESSSTLPPPAKTGVVLLNWRPPFIVKAKPDEEEEIAALMALIAAISYGGHN